MNLLSPRKKVSLLPLIGLLGIVILATVIVHTGMVLRMRSVVRHAVPVPDLNNENDLFSEKQSRTGNSGSAPDIALLLRDGIQRWRQGDQKNAVSVFRTVLVFQPDNFTALSYLGVQAFQEGKYSEADFFFRKQILHHPELSGGYVNLGLLRLHQNRIESALKLFQRAGHLDPLSFRVAINLAKLYAFTGEINRSLLQLKKAAQADPEKTLHTLDDPMLDTLRKTWDFRAVEKKLRDSVGKESRQ